jgi:hypothetical protein
MIYLRRTRAPLFQFRLFVIYPVSWPIVYFELKNTIANAPLIAKAAFPHGIQTQVNLHPGTNIL